MDSSSLKDKAVNGAMWRIMEISANQVVAFIVGIILARLLAPETLAQRLIKLKKAYRYGRMLIRRRDILSLILTAASTAGSEAIAMA